MRKSKIAALLLFVVQLLPCALAQVVSPSEIKDHDLRSLQQQYIEDLKQLGEEVTTLQFQYPFYLSRKLDLDETQQQRAPQSSIQFNRYNGQVVLAITGNYFAAYSSQKLNQDQRARQTFLEVGVPLLKAMVPRFQTNKDIKGYAIEVSHHVLGKVMGVAMETPENLMVYVPQAAAIRLVSAKDDSVRQSALLQGQSFINGQPVTIWFSGEGPQLAANVVPPNPASQAADIDDAKAEIVPGNTGHNDPGAATALFNSMKGTTPIPEPARDTSPAALIGLQTANQETINQILKDLDSQAHFVNYSAPTFVAFRQGTYLEVSLNTTLTEAATGSRYKVAAMAFDDHIVRLIRPVLGYFKGDQNFSGIGFSTTVHVPGKTQASSTSEAVEFFFPFSALRCYEKYDCTGQQLIDAGTVLINGERASIDLEIAEAR